MMEISAGLAKAAATVTAVGVVGGGAVTLNELHVAAEDFDKYIQQQQIADDRDYVLQLKKDIREVQGALATNPDEEYLVDALAELIDELCEFRPDDRMCEVDE
jgi:hypothetical protein